jgi:hypothetical protein
MAKEINITWVSEIKGKNYSFNYEKRKKLHVLTVNGVETIVKGDFLSLFYGIDTSIDLDGSPARFVAIKNEPDIAVDGVYLRSGKKYLARPAWALVFIIISLAIPVVSIGGALPALLGLGGAALNVLASRNTLPLAVRILLCLIATIVVWVVFYVIWYGTTAALNRPTT